MGWQCRGLYEIEATDHGEHSEHDEPQSQESPVALFGTVVVRGDSRHRPPCGSRHCVEGHGLVTIDVWQGLSVGVVGATQIGSAMDALSSNRNRCPAEGHILHRVATFDPAIPDQRGWCPL